MPVSKYQRGYLPSSPWTTLKGIIKQFNDLCQQPTDTSGKSKNHQEWSNRLQLNLKRMLPPETDASVLLSPTPTAPSLKLSGAPPLAKAAYQASKNTLTFWASLGSSLLLQQGELGHQRVKHDAGREAHSQKPEIGCCPFRYQQAVAVTHIITSL